SIDAVIRLGDDIDAMPDDLNEDSSDMQYVLDGQQRLTSITRVFLNSNEKRAYYFDLQKMAANFDDENVNWIAVRSKSDNESKERISNNRYIRSDIALDQVKSDIYVSEYIEDSDDFDEMNRSERRLLAAKIKGYFETIRKYQVPVTILESSSGLESICRVFETINSTGTRLTTYDLAVARFYPDPDLHQMLKETLEANPVLHEFSLEGERVLQVIYLINAYEEGKFPEPSRGALLSLDPQIIKTHWQRAALGLNEAYKWAKDNGARPETMANPGILVPLAAFNVLRPNFKDDLDVNFNSLIKRWYYSRLLSQESRSATNYRVARDFINLLDFSDKKEQLEIMSVKMNALSIAKIYRSSDIRFKAILGIMAMNAKEDLITGKSLDEVEYHHIFPRSFVKSKGIPASKIESVVNRIAVSKNTNRNLGDKEPAKYIESLIKRAVSDGTIDDVNARMSSLIMPIGIYDEDYMSQYKTDNIDYFINNRSNIIFNRIKNLLGSALIEEMEDSDDLEE
ncbi:GmrSD restriction endonuclease domain-containing protein, partial [Deinococcus aquaticus]|uniref:GmrSD restriction endonuclease domain-containing protein n=1 Tax=Deinococcus aquaticus TaxID=328692 RepID=UPI003F483FA7